MNALEMLPLRLTAHGGEEQHGREYLLETHLCFESEALQQRCAES